MSKNAQNILMLFSSSEIGGAERSLGNMTFINSDKSINYILATFGSIGPLSEWIQSKSIDIDCFDFKILKLIKYINLKKPDIIYVIGFRLSIFLRFYCKFFSKNYLVQGVRWNPNSKSVLDRVFRKFEFLFSFLLDGYIVNSNAAKETLQSLSINKVELIYNGINLKPSRSNLEIKKYIIRIVKDLPEAKFLFLGYDNLNGQIQTNIIKMGLSSNVECLGFQKNVGNFLSKSSIFVLPSLYGEGCPTSILEAFSYRLPVIANDIDGIPELVSHNIDGILTNKSSNSSMELAIKELLLNTEKAKRLGENGYQKVIEQFQLTNMIQKHNSFFKTLK
jgi:glycosyltransferase involved in cell wall biosynthesis